MYEIRTEASDLLIIDFIGVTSQMNILALELSVIWKYKYSHS